ncbi:MAG: serine/threonine-protein kinase, partial [Ktedonobacterales bacterium]
MVDLSALATLAGMTVGAYILDELAQSSELGALYLAHRQGESGVFQVRLLATDAAQRPDTRSAYLANFERQARQLASLQHPYLLPLVDFGVVRGIPYLVWPHLPLRPLSARLEQSGPLDLLTIGRYLDQIAAALEYARERDMLHLNLSAACVFIQRDGRLLVADLGVRPLIDLGRSNAEQYAISDPGEACAPEQLLHQMVDASTDVYALGQLLFEMLAGRPLYDGPTRQIIAQQHLRGSAVPSLGMVRHDLPPTLDDVLARALARNRRERYQRIGALANAYNSLVAPNNPARVPFVNASIAASGRLSNRPLPTDLAAQPFDLQTGETSVVAQRRTSIGLIALVAVLLVVLVGGGLAYFAIQSQSASHVVTAQISFTDASGTAPGHSNGVQITLHNAPAPPAGNHYVLWLIDDQHETVYNLGSLVQQQGVFTLASNAAPAQGGDLLALGDRLEVTQEHST